MYQDKQSLLNTTNTCSPRSTEQTNGHPPLETPLIPTDAQHHPPQQTRKQIAHLQRTFAREIRRQQNTIRAHALLANIENDALIELPDDQRPYREINILGSTLEGIFDASLMQPDAERTRSDADPRAVPRAQTGRFTIRRGILPIGIDHAISSSLLPSPADGDSMDISSATPDMNAIDAGSSALGRQSPSVAYFLRNSRALKTRRLYQWAWRRALKACHHMNRCALPMSEATAAMVIIDAVEDGLVFGSIRVIANVISVAHAIAVQPDPTRSEAFHSVMRGVGRVLGDRPSGKVALSIDEMRRIRETCDADPNRTRALRDWAIISFGFAGCFRRSEIVARNHADLEFGEDGLRVYVDRSKTDQFGRGAYVTIRPATDPQLCPIEALRAWIALAPGPGPLFRPVMRGGGVLYKRLQAGTITNLVKAFGIVLELPEDRLGAHSLRAGMITALLDQGVSTIQTIEHSRHSSVDTLRRYYRPRGNKVNYTKMSGL